MIFDVSDRDFGTCAIMAWKAPKGVEARFVEPEVGPVEATFKAGGQTRLLLIDPERNYREIWRTLDDAAAELLASVKAGGLGASEDGTSRTL